jgi:hypothetical protein
MAAMFENRISRYLQQDSPAIPPTATSGQKTDSTEPTIPNGFAVIPIAGMFSGFKLPASAASIYELARRQAIAQSQERLLSLLRSRWEFLKKAEG